MSPFKIHREFEAPEEFRDTIKCIWYDSTEFGDEVTDFEVQPDGYAEIIFYFGTCNISHHQQPLPSPFLMGLLNKPAIFYTQNRLQIIGIRCYPWAVFDLLGLPSGNDVLRVFEHPIAKLQPVLNALVEEGKIDEAIFRIKDYLLEMRRTAIDATLSKAGNAMSDAKGTLPVNQVADAAHATVRTLERKFKQSSGHTVKDVSALMRFEQIRNQLWVNPQANLAGLAHKFGYTDQSHLSRDFKKYSGTTPAAFARKAKQRQQTLGSDFVAFVQS